MENGRTKRKGHGRYARPGQLRNRPRHDVAAEYEQHAEHIGGRGPLIPEFAHRDGRVEGRPTGEERREKGSHARIFREELGLWSWRIWEDLTNLATQGCWCLDAQLSLRRARLQVILWRMALGNIEHSEPDSVRDTYLERPSRSHRSASGTRTG